MEKVKIAMIGTGDISGIYLQNLTGLFKEVELIGVCDLVREKAEKAQAKYGIRKLYENMYEAFNDPEVEVILNLTRPYEHYGVTKPALLAGKHVYSEKPLGATIEEGVELYNIAKEKGLMLGGAPDTFMGAGIQTARKLIDDGVIGTPIGSAAFMICRGHETWHPDPAFYYQRGGGPMLDMGPYYVTAMVNLMGGVKRVMGASKKSFEKRMITSAPKFGTPIDVDVNTYIAGTVQYESGAIGTLFTTFDAYYPYQARFEIYGSAGTLFVPDPNTFGGPLKLYRPETKDVAEIPMMFDYQENSRGLGLADMCKALRSGRTARADVQQTFHVLDIMTGFDRSAKEDKWIEMSTEYKRADAMVKATLPGILD